jgi:hypothetical protein
MNQGITNKADESLDFPSEVGKFAKVLTQVGGINERPREENNTSKRSYS